MLGKMKDWQKFFKGKKITQMGLGLLGRGVGDAVFLVQQGVELLVTDLKSKKELAPSLKKLKKYNQPKAGRPRAGNITYCLGGHRLEDFRNQDFILKAAGVPLDSPFIAEARKNGVPIEMDASLFFKLMPKGVTFIGVTGTRGKTTTAYLIYEMLKASKKKVFLVGNIKDTATLPILEKVKSSDFVVAELDSWQLQGFGESQISPHISVFTTFLSDHMNYYKGDMILYFKDKANIFKYQKKGDVLILGDGVVEAARHLGVELPSGALVACAKDLPKNWKLKIIGEHNRYNAACALAVARVLKIPDEISRKAIENFKGVPGRLEFLREIRGIKIYNDTCATTPDATIAALRALNTKQIILILGGADKGLDMSELIAEIQKYCKVVILLPGTGTDKLISNSKFLISNQVLISNVKNLKEAVKQATKISKRGDIILFSPAFASFGMFKNEYDRGEQFEKLVKGL
ncbi:MAG: UDP-N-acetylmuramoylalanine--D-glutamate ligase [Parcubacteria group bacterium Gr01-1014_73]|nr:MAG: UDP-N-acetylmuramoylalanine--D-glutamate ligase [Parcubacteria group bacterium Gr01-1014_73]